MEAQNELYYDEVMEEIMAPQKGITRDFDTKYVRDDVFIVKMTEIEPLQVAMNLDITLSDDRYKKDENAAIYKNQDAEYDRAFTTDLLVNPFLCNPFGSNTQKGEKSEVTTDSSDDCTIYGEQVNNVRERRRCLSPEVDAENIRFCRFYGSMAGCKQGQKCKYSHANPNHILFCKWFNSKYGCKYGQRCIQRHHIYPPYIPKIEEAEQTESATTTETNDYSDIAKEDNKLNQFEMNINAPVFVPTFPTPNDQEFHHASNMDIIEENKQDRSEHKIQSLASIIIELNDKLDEAINENKRLQNEVERHEILMNKMAIIQSQSYAEIQQLKSKINKNPMMENIEYRLLSMKMDYQALEKQLESLSMNHWSCNSDQKQQISEQDKINKWLTNINMSQYSATFFDLGFDEFDMIADITMDDLNEMNIHKLSHQKKIIKEAQKLNQH